MRRCCGFPASITVQTEMDALAPALEAYFGTYAMEETDRYAVAYIRLIHENLEYALANPSD
ncbi:iron-containing alcohol dehydrogenase [Hungatella sp.]|uniref:iron-containing alcohol dehydrogenase n=1 Tax=Hungatella sp. TaxID=2613924 RepID=UPI000E44C796|nr:iron-containing alcohol dehydrogenase [Hungatella hathewayi]